MGNLVRDPELRVTPSGLSICRFTIACSRTIRSEKVENGVREETAFVDVECFGKQAETVSKFFSKGKPIFVEGHLRLNEWQTQAGEKRSKLLVTLENFVFVGPSGAQGGPDGGKSAVSFSYEKINSDEGSSESKTPFTTAEDEDVPF